MAPLDLALHYFALSNASDFAGIGRLLHAGTTYRSGNGEFHLGAGEILAMQRAYHGPFSVLQWTVDQAEEIKPGVVRLEFTFSGETGSGSPVAYGGVEHILVRNNRIEHIAVQRRTADA